MQLANKEFRCFEKGMLFSNKRPQQTTTQDASSCTACDEMDCTLQDKDDKPVRVSSKWISLDACDQRYYALCQNLQSSEVTTITKISEKGA